MEDRALSELVQELGRAVLFLNWLDQLRDNLLSNSKWLDFRILPYG